jgi:ferritin-like metal-binding protein YciE
MLISYTSENMHMKNVKKQNGQQSGRGQALAKDNLLEEFFVDEIKDIYWAEKHLIKTLPKMKKAATTPELQQAFADHLEVTREHVTRLEEVFELLGEKAVAKKCDAMEGITKEGESIIEDTEEGTATRDVGLILAGQKVEHYEISTYGGLAQLARTLNHEDVAEILEKTLSEEKEADKLLTSVAENSVNYEAAGESE